MSTGSQALHCPFCHQPFVGAALPVGQHTVQCPYCRQVFMVQIAPVAGPVGVSGLGVTTASSPLEQATGKTGHAFSRGASQILPPWEMNDSGSVELPPCAPLAPSRVAEETTAERSPAADGSDEPGEAPVSDASTWPLPWTNVWWWAGLISTTVLVALFVFWAGRTWMSRDTNSPVTRTEAGAETMSTEIASNAHRRAASPAANSSGGSTQQGQKIRASSSRLSTDDLLAGHWTDASQASQKLGAFEVRVLGAELGPVLGRDQNRRIVTLADLGLQILLEIRNRSVERLTYESWYALAVHGEQVVGVDLLDNSGRQYPLLAFVEGTRIRNHTPRAELAPGELVRDVLVFHLPPEVDRTKVTEFFLWIDMSAQGGEGEFRFKIPLEMVQNWQPTE